MSKLCTRHTHDLHEDIKKKGMGRYVSLNTQDVKRKTHLWLHGAATPADFDPYVVAVLEINKKAHEEYGIPHHHTCPLCYIDHILGMRAATTWIDNVTDLMVVTCRTNNLKVG